MTPGESIDGTHACTHCGEDKPLAQFYRWRSGKTRAAWYCDPCNLAISPSTDRVRTYRSDPEKRERDREVSRRWKREHLGQPGNPKKAA